MSALLTPPGTVTPPPKPVVIPAPVPQAVPGPPQFLPLYRIPVAEYERWTSLGVFDTGPKVELLNGYLVEKMPGKPPHANSVNRLIRRFNRHLPDGWVARCQTAATVGASQPEPDLAVVRGDESTYANRHPIPADFGIAIEVAESSLRGDRTDRLDIYAAAGVPEYWIVNLVDGQVEVYTRPQPEGTYAGRKDYLPGSAVPVVLDGQHAFDLPVGELF